MTTVTRKQAMVCARTITRPAFPREDVIGTAAVTVEFKTDATVVPIGPGTRAARQALVQEVPAALSECLVDQDAGKCLGFGGQTGASQKTPGRQSEIGAPREELDANGLFWAMMVYS